MDRLRATFYPGSPSLSLSSISHIRCDLFRRFPCLLDFLGVLFYSHGAGWISHFFQGSRGGNDTRLHCLGTVEISGFVFVFVFRYTFVTFDSRLSFYSLSLFWLVHRFMGMGDM
jgi:hypothetical protein